MKKISRITPSIRTKLDLKAMEYDRKYQNKDDSKKRKDKKIYLVSKGKKAEIEEQKDSLDKTEIQDEFIKTNLAISKIQRLAMLNRIKYSADELNAIDASNSKLKGQTIDDKEK